MKYRQLGRTGLNVSVYALGTNSFGRRADEATSIAILHHAIDHGVNLIDTANIYFGSEDIIGKALVGRRHEVILATKCGSRIGEGPNDTGSSRYHILREVEASLRRLQTDVIDLYQIHRFDPATPLEETLRALDDLVRQGKVRYIGCSNYTAWQLCKALWTSDRFGLARYDSVQPPYSPAHRRIEQELLPLCRDQGVGVIVYTPLGGGLFTGKYRPGAAPPPKSRAVTQAEFGDRFLTDRNLGLASTIAGIAEAAGAGMAELVLAWVMAQEGVTSAIVGATSASQQEQNLRAVELRVDPGVLAQVTEASKAFAL
jgi:aryl-alcohol dehydrogenase-like predicted oxidoreductase